MIELKKKSTSLKETFANAIELDLFVVEDVFR
jgi:hypothetical protein